MHIVTYVHTSYVFIIESMYLTAIVGWCTNATPTEMMKFVELS